MSETPEPDWHLLPHSPVSFFGLSEQYEMRDLKRAYGRLIKKYRPDFHPDEFQKIRAAYEALKSNEAIDRAFLTPDINMELSSPIEELPGSLTGTISYNESRPPLISLRERLDSQADLQQVYSDLRQQTILSEQDYVGLAVLADAVETDEEESFLNWIITGLETRPASAVLISLTQQYCQQSVPDEQIESVISQLADRLPQLTFAQVTLPLWLRLIRIDSQVANKIHGEPRFPRVWASIGGNPEFAGSYAQFQLSLELLPALAVTDDEARFEELALAIDMEHQFFYPQDDFRREFADTMRYFIVKSQFETVMQHKHQLLRELIVDYCTQFDKLAVLEKYRERYRLALPGLCDLYSTAPTPYETTLTRIARWLSADARRYLEVQEQSEVDPLSDITTEDRNKLTSRFWWKNLFAICLTHCLIPATLIIWWLLGDSLAGISAGSAPPVIAAGIQWSLIFVIAFTLALVLGGLIYVRSGTVVRMQMLLKQFRREWRRKISASILNRRIGEEELAQGLSAPLADQSDQLEQGLQRLVAQDPLLKLLTTLFPNWTDPWNEHPFVDDSPHA
ncbi:J domain-containing protein [Rubinisphaera margarita]|uniref:J domain-containing protein n=1 Tax=Rubinisphaera margarita TaxID=2909586 RepID=UPI001EE92D9A|nr:J domain-containing protein [Rubinisphaera margarita]MCG6156152.1 J domain-containing protein [Rubinisphaera margarita]